MNIRVCGFKLELHPRVTMKDVIHHAHQKTERRFTYDRHDRILRLLEKDGYLLGSIWTDRGHKQYTQLDKETNKMTTRGCAPGKSHPSGRAPHVHEPLHQGAASCRVRREKGARMRA